MKPKVCPECKCYLSCDETEWYCTECNYIETLRVYERWDWYED